MGGRLTNQGGGAGDTWRIELQEDETLNDSDKNFPVPAGVEQQIFWILVEFTSTAVVGNRQLVIEVQDAAADVIGEWARCAVVQPANVTYHYQLAPNVPDLSALRDGNYLTTPIPSTSFLKATDVLRIYDNNAVDAAADDMIIHIQHGERPVL